MMMIKVLVKDGPPKTPLKREFSSPNTIGNIILLTSKTTF